MPLRRFARKAMPAMRLPPNTALLIGCASVLLAACQPAAPAPPAEPPLAGARIGGPFTLTAMDGTRVNAASFPGQYRLIYFGYSFCPDVCPVDLQWLMAGLRRAEAEDPARAARVQPLFVTLDPARDTPEVLRRYTAAFHPRLIGLRGSEAETADAAGKFLVQYRKVAGSTPGSYLVSHTQLAYLMAPDGKPLALIPLDDIRTPDVNEGDPALVAREILRWVH